MILAPTRKNGWVPICKTQLYGVETRALKQAVRRNIERFPQDFLFELSKEEWDSLRSQIVTLEKGRGKYSKYPPFAFTEQAASYKLQAASPIVQTW